MNSIDVIIPTMWKDSDFTERLKKYCLCDSVKSLYIIDNDRNHRPKDDILKHEKIHLIDYGRNIYVNPAWNEGYYHSDADVLCLLNDDVEVDVELFDQMTNLDFTDIDLIGVHLKGSVDNFHIVDHPDKEERLFRLAVDKTQPIGGQSYAFGVCMFIKRSSYKPIPSLYQIWFGDDYLIQNCENIYCLKTSKIKGEISKTIVNLEKTSEIKRRIALDTHNAYKYNHFLNAKNWDMLQGAANKQEKPYINTFEQEYRIAKSTKSDINENLHILYELAKECEHVTEMGVRYGVSTRAFLNTDVKLISYDVVLDGKVNQLFHAAKANGKDVQYIKANVLNIEIEPTDLLFIDTLHTYPQLKQELKLHGNKAKKYLAFHDTYTFGLTSEDLKDKKGLLTAIMEFLIENPQWKVKYHKTNNNGLTVLEKVNEQVQYISSTGRDRKTCGSNCRCKGHQK